MSATALLLGVALFGNGHPQGAVAAAATYGTLVAVWHLLRRMQKMGEASVALRDDTDPLVAACETIASARGLSPREGEVLLLLAQGRSRTFIQSELFLADGTVKTHIRHIYQKLDVHSKQELISLIQSRSLFDSSDGAILDCNGEKIPGLHAAGEFGSVWGYLYQGNGNVGEAMAFGHISARSCLA